MKDKREKHHLLEEIKKLKEENQRLKADRSIEYYAVI